MLNILIVMTYAAAGAIAGGAIGMWFGLPISQGMMLSAMFTMVCAQIHLGLLRRRDKRRNMRDIKMLKNAGLSFQRALEQTGEKMAEISQVVEIRTNENNRKIVSELQMLEGLMREFASRISEKAKEIPAPKRAALPGPQRPAFKTLGDGTLLEMIRASLEQNRVDLYLQPTVSLPQRKLRYYEALSRLRAEDGTVIMPAQYMRIAAPAGLMSVVDNLLLFRCVQVVRKLTQKNREIAIFCNIAGDTLADAEFFPQFLEYMHHNRDLAGQIVFEFSQDALAKAGQAGEANLSYLSNLGFALSLDHVETLAIDFARLKRLGFRHIKLRASTLTGGMGNAQAAVAAEDFKGLLARHGLNLIAERVEDEKTVLQLLDYGVDFAQGYLFGEPRAVRDEVLKEAPAAERPAGPASVIPLRKAG
jgi:cyclic-di-GMP phosphodiesterase TipF (flagellum assembly factor)